MPGAGSRKLSIMLLSRSLEVGGAERQLVMLAKMLRDLGHVVRIALFYRRGSFVEEAESAGIEILDLGKQGRWDVAPFLMRTVRAVRRTRPDVIYSILGGANVVASLVRPFARRTRVVWTIVNSAKDPSVNHAAAHLGFYIEAALSRSADAVIANSSAGRDFGRSRGFPASRIFVVPNGIDTDRFRPDPSLRAMQRRALGLRKGDVAVGVLGRLNVTKDYATFLRAAAIVAKRRPNCRFLCVGGGPERPHLEQLAQELGIAPRVSFTGELDPAAALNAFDIACSPSITEGFSNSVAEAMACEVPCVVTDVGDSAAIVGDLGMVVPPSSPPSLAEAIERQIDGLGTHDGAAARRRIVENFSASAKVDRTLEVFRSLLPPA
jgi:glycosyltransferase involved in cell wall biosynthesis